MKFIERNRWWMLGVDTLLLCVALVGAFWLPFGFNIPQRYLSAPWQLLGTVIGLRLLLLVAAGVYRGEWRYISVSDLIAIVRAVTWGTLVVAFCSYLVTRLAIHSPWMDIDWLQGYPVRVLVAEWLGDIILIGGLRMWLRLFKQYRITATYRNVVRKRALIIGAGDAGEMVARQMQSHPDYGYLPVGFIDDDPAKHGHQIHGIPILGSRDAINSIIEKKRIEEIIIAMPSTTGKVVKEVVEHCKQVRIKFKIVPGIKEIIEGDVNINQIREVELEDLLRRPQANTSLDEIAGYLTGRRVLVTGAGGSIGSELCRQIAPFEPGQLLLLGRGENSIYEISQELGRSCRALNQQNVIADVTDRVRIRQVFDRHRPQVVFHAAAHKHVPLMELNPGEALKNNVFGTKIVVDAALESGAERLVYISTDKAVNPSSVMGASKRLAEEVVRSNSVGAGAKLITVRFGNVLGSRGSVVPLFKSQIAAGGPVTVTHPEVTRFFMTIPEAVRLVIQAGAMGQGGEVFVLDMGQPVRIMDMALDLIKLSGLEPDKDIKIEFTGLRPGEKLYEELLTAEEGVNATRHSQIFVSRGMTCRNRQLTRRLAHLRVAVDDGRQDKILEAIRQWLPGFRSS